MCMSRMFAFMSAVVTVQGSVGMFVVYRELLKVVGFISRCEVLCVVYLYSGCDGYCAFLVGHKRLLLFTPCYRSQVKQNVHHRYQSDTCECFYNLQRFLCVCCYVLDVSFGSKVRP